MILDIFRFLQPQPRSFPIKVAEIGSKVTMDCTTNDRSAQSSLLYRTGGIWKNITYSKPGNSAKQVFTISQKFALKDSGHYKCVAVNSTGYRIEWPNSNGMVILGSFVKLPELTVTPKYQRVLSLGDSVNITCSAAEGHLKWYREETRDKFKIVPASMVYKAKPRKYRESTSILMIKNARPSDAGLYKCVLKYRGKEAFELASVKVFGE